MLLLAAGGGSSAAATVYVAPIGRKIGVVRSDAADHNAPTGMSGQVR